MYSRLLLIFVIVWVAACSEASPSEDPTCEEAPADALPEPAPDHSSDKADALPSPSESSQEEPDAE